MVQVGDKVRFVPSHGADMDDGTGQKVSARAVTGTVYYVNEVHRHFGLVAEVGITGATIRESFKF